MVHLLNGDALEFTTAYLTARLAKPSEPGEVAGKPEATRAGRDGTRERPAPPPPRARTASEPTRDRRHSTGAGQDG